MREEFVLCVGTCEDWSPSHLVGLELRLSRQAKFWLDASPSHTVGLEQFSMDFLLSSSRLCSGSLHPTQWAQNLLTECTDFWHQSVCLHPTQWAQNGWTYNSHTKTFTVTIPPSGLRTCVGKAKKLWLHGDVAIPHGGLGTSRKKLYC